MKNIEDFSPFYNKSTLEVYGNKSPIFRIKEDEAILRAMFPQCIFRMVEGEHNLFKTNRIAFMKEVLSFI